MYVEKFVFFRKHYVDFHYSNHANLWTKKHEKTFWIKFVLHKINYAHHKSLKSLRGLACSHQVIQVLIHYDDNRAKPLLIIFAAGTLLPKLIHYPLIDIHYERFYRKQQKLNFDMKTNGGFF